MKVWEKVSPLLRLPESNSPPSAVAVWVALSLLVQITVSPTEMVKVSGLKAKPVISTLFDCGVSPSSPVVSELVSSSPPMQPIIVLASSRAKISRTLCFIKGARLNGYMRTFMNLPMP